jgi:ABC-2 type transport system ATP-binding protein
MIDVRHLTKRYGKSLAVDDLSFTVKPGLVTGFLGPNGAGKTTTIRLILGLAGALGAPQRGSAAGCRVLSVGAARTGVLHMAPY